MVARLTRPAEAAAVQSQQVPGWGAPPAQPTAQNPPPAGWPALAAEQQQREAIRQQVAPDAQAQVGAAFGPAAQQAAAAVQGGNYGPPTGAPAPESGALDQWRGPATTAAAPVEAAKRTRGPNKAKDEPSAEPKSPFHTDTLLCARTDLLKIAFADATTSLEDGLEIADELWKWLTKVE